MALKKLSITEEEMCKVRQLLDEGLSPYKIATEMNLSQSTLWRNMEFMGWNKKKVEVVIKKTKYFNWNDFKNKSII